MFVYIKNEKLKEKVPIKYSQGEHKVNGDTYTVYPVDAVPKELLQNFTLNKDFFFSKRLFF